MKKLLLAIVVGLAFQVSSFGQTYCMSGGPISTFDSDVSDVVLTGATFSISNLNTCPGVSGVDDYTATDSADITLGTCYAVDVTFSSCSGWYYSGAGEVWIDWNDDGTFQPTESIGSVTFLASDLPLTKSFTFSVPLSAAIGETRMRVMQWESGNPPLDPCGSPYYGSVEDYKIVVDGTAPPCPIPSDLMATGVTATGATLSWNSTGSTFNVEYGPAGFTPGTGTMVSAVSGTSTILSTLTANTAYEFYVQNDCTGSGNGTSGWSCSAGSFMTPCTTFSSPYVENFDSASWVPNFGWPPIDSFDPCWSRTPNNPGSFPYIWQVYSGSSPNWQTGPDADHTSGMGQYLYTNPNGSPNDTAIVTSPEINLTGLTTPSLSFYFHMYGAQVNKMYVDVSSNSGSTWSNLGVLNGQYQTSESAPWEEALIDLSAYANQTVMFRWRAVSGGCCSGDMAIDDVTVDNAPPCLKPSFLTFFGLTDTSVYVTFNSTGTNFNFEWGPTGFTQGTGVAGSAGNDTILITGLAGNTLYDIYVQNDCSGSGNGSSAWSGPLTINTLCSPFTATHAENFDAIPVWAYEPIDCWDVISLGNVWGTANQNVTSTDQFSVIPAATAPNILEFYTSDATWAALLTPQYTDLDGNTNQIRFKCGVGWTTADLIVGTMSDPMDTSTFVAVDTIAPPMNAWGDFTILLNNVPTGHDYVAFVSDVMYTSYFFDNYFYEPIPSCIPPNSLVTTVINENDITFNWQPGQATGTWVFEYGPVGFVQGTGTTDTASSTTHTITGLATATCYDFYLQGVCPGPDPSPWIGPFSFCTDICSNPCMYTIELNDQWGSWPSSTVDIVVGGGVTYTFSHDDWSTTSSTETFPMCDGMNFSVIWNAGWGTSESFTITDQNGVVVFDQPVDPSGIPSGVLFNGTGSCPTCIPPNSLGSANSQTTSVDLSWVNGTAGSWSNIEWGPVGFVQGTGTGTVVTNVTSPYTLSGLTTATCYDFYVQDSCSASDVSVWSGPYTFCTSVCDLVNQCTFTINMIDTYGDGWNGAIVGFRQQGVNVALAGSTFTGGSSATETFNLCDGDTVEMVVIDQGQYNGECGFDVVDPFGITMFSFTPDWSLFVDGAVLGTFVVNCTAPPCPLPSNLDTISVDSTSAVVGWTAGTSGAATTYVEYGPPGFIPGTGTVVTATTNSANLTGLTPNTNYCVYISEVCSSGDTTWTVGPMCFFTDCGNINGDVFADPIMVPSLPYTVVGSTAMCYTNSQDNSSPDVFYQITTGAGATDITVSLCGTTTNYDSYLRLFDMSGTQLAFDDDYCAGARSEIPNFAVTPSTSYIVMVEGFSNNSGTYELVITENGTAVCADPTGVAATNISCNELEIDWNQLGDGSLIEYEVSGFTPGTGIQVAANPPYVIPGLNPNTSYDIYVLDTCTGIGTSNWVGPYTVSTTGNNVWANFSFNMTGSTAASMTFSFDAGGSANGNTYDWDFGNGLTGSGATPSVTYTTNGSYNVVLTVTGDCGTDDTTITVLANISAEELSGINGVSLYPNPTSNVVRIDFNTVERLDVDVVLMNSVGQVIQVTEHEAVSGSTHQTLSMGNLPKGVYLVQLRTAKGTVTRRISLQ